MVLESVLRSIGWWKEEREMGKRRTVGCCSKEDHDECRGLGITSDDSEVDGFVFSIS